MTGYINEIFSSIQGEGIYTGLKQVFVRFAGCELFCRWCDSVHARKPTKGCLVEYSCEDAIVVPNPITVEQLIQYIDKFLRKEKFHSISTTGGEPLLQHEFLKALTSALHKKKFKIYLETAGTLTNELSEIIDDIDYISMDFKLPSSTGMKPFWNEHEEFLKIAKNKEAFVKIIVTNDTDEEDIVKAAEIIAGIDRKIPLIIQPVTSENSKLIPANSQLESWKSICKQRIDSVSIMPQFHKLIGVK